jgi:hypothetical protein
MLLGSGCSIYLLYLGKVETRKYLSALDDVFKDSKTLHKTIRHLKGGLLKLKTNDLQVRLPTR